VDFVAAHRVPDFVLHRPRIASDLFHHSPYGDPSQTAWLFGIGKVRPRIILALKHVFRDRIVVRIVDELGMGLREPLVEAFQAFESTPP
jgi:hypothetical protein